MNYSNIPYILLLKIPLLSDNLQFIDSVSKSLLELVLNNLTNLHLIASFNQLTTDDGAEQSGFDAVDRYASTNSLDDMSSLNSASITPDKSSMHASNHTTSSITGSSVFNLVLGLCSEGQSKAQCIYLGPLNRKSVWEVLISIYNTAFDSSGEIIIDSSDSTWDEARKEELLNKLHYASGGHPLNIHEIASSVITRGACSSGLDFFNALEEVLLKIKSNNIEDLIFYNLDQLSSDCRLVIKAASVIASTFPFNAIMIGHMLSGLFSSRKKLNEQINSIDFKDFGVSEVEEDVDNVGLNLEASEDEAEDMSGEGGDDPEALCDVFREDTFQRIHSDSDFVQISKEILHEILIKSTFLQLYQKDESSSFSKNVEKVALSEVKSSFDIQNDTLFSFSSAIYQDPIYKMLIGSQKKTFHSKFAGIFLIQSYLLSCEV